MRQKAGGKNLAIPEIYACHYVLIYLATAISKTQLWYSSLENHSDRSCLTEPVSSLNMHNVV
ncbi:MAG: hypothetical protein RMY64_07000 [Nostoc sp. DedQUE08]|uniref:hypothetical protein n=1 Tax=Nostoc sp. DedQUE08 TaxID=3075393 RepID=UPI002AD1E077|nr:hypothetical protein [Nostoc sp. DedQUE08]MDZ8065374.1 hypothetical protein [Nostoc sp. DedQUE08]